MIMRVSTASYAGVWSITVTVCPEFESVAFCEMMNVEPLIANIVVLLGIPQPEICWPTTTFLPVGIVAPDIEFEF